MIKIQIKKKTIQKTSISVLVCIVVYALIKYFQKIINEIRDDLFIHFSTNNN